ncbi:hypothetical protein [Peptostreptococcus sp. D1]|uniref:hypothetical protein n=1 Tax=Peptostreptococcus sp. D1 TaxID=72304 RepID=UPI0008DF5B56|nr:hypothetical protein [Peptostreptococcus sp. D1]SFE92206.1 hypothetical protein SAMN02910278_02074 [Peptostreptococcus sp. D1]
MSNLNNIARLIKNKAKSEAEKATDGLELLFGEITNEGIITNRFKRKPIKDYKMLQTVSKKKTVITKTESYAGHTHDVISPILSIGDIVVLAIVEGEFVVLGKVEDTDE